MLDAITAQRDTTAAMVRDAELFFVSSPLTTLARAAGASLPEYRLHPEDVPSPGRLVRVRRLAGPGR